MNKFKIWAKERPAAYFLGNNISEEKKKEKWIEVMCDDPEIQKMIDKDIHYSKTSAHAVYMYLLEHPKATIHVSEE